MKRNDIMWLIGSDDIKVRPLQPYSEVVIHFLDDLSVELRKAVEKERMSDIMSLAFWCRKSNLNKMKEQAQSTDKSMGRGLVFHITPSNVPINFAFSYFFGLLSGNANIVRIPSKAWRQVDIILEAIKSVIEKPEYKIIKDGTAFVKYDHDKEITDEFSAMSDGRVIWGGDEAIRTIRQSPLKPKGVEIVFADRYSMGIIGSKAVMEASEEELKELATKFYNDTYLMDQNACSTPHLLLWRGEDEYQAKERFWNAVADAAKVYDLEPIKAIDKYTELCVRVMEGDLKIGEIANWSNVLYTIDLEHLPEDICALRGRFGMFYQYNLKDILELKCHVTEKVQTVLYYGIDKNEVFEFVRSNNLRGIDRIVPFGNSLDMNEYWDGYDIVGQLSRRIQTL